MNLKTRNFAFVRSFSRSKYCDVKVSTLDAGPGRYIEAHRVVLAAVSSKLEKLIDKAGEGVEGLLTVRNIGFEVLEKIVELIYSGKVEIEDPDVEDFQDGLDMLRIEVNYHEDQNETLRSIYIPADSEDGKVNVSHRGNVPVSEVIQSSDKEVKNLPVKEGRNISIRDSRNAPLFLATPTTRHKEDEIKVSRNISSSAVGVPVKAPEKFSGAKSRSRLLSISSNDSDSVMAPLASTPLSNIPETVTFSSPAVSNISSSVRKLHKHRRQTESVAGGLADSESVTSPKTKVPNPNYSSSEVSVAESETDGPPLPDHNMNNIPTGQFLIKYNVSMAKRSVVKCPWCDVQLAYDRVTKHCKRKHPGVDRSSRKVCDVCVRQSIPSFMYELHLQVHHPKDADEIVYGRDDLDKAGSNRIVGEDSLVRSRHDSENSEKEKMTDRYKSVDCVTVMSPNLKRKLEGGKDKELKSQKVETERQSLLESSRYKYKAFFEEVSERGVGWYNRKVKCELCGDGKLHYLRNFGRHLRHTHEHLVKCPTCEREFNKEQMKRHTTHCGQGSQEINQSV